MMKSQFSYIQAGDPVPLEELGQNNIDPGIDDGYQHYLDNCFAGLLQVHLFTLGCLFIILPLIARFFHRIFCNQLYLPDVFFLCSGDVCKQSHVKEMGNPFRHQRYRAFLSEGERRLSSALVAFSDGD